MFSLRLLPRFLSVEVFYYAWKKLRLLKSEYEQELSQSQSVDQPKVRSGRDTKHFRSWLYFVII